jgi:hypothetical protein
LQGAKPPPRKLTVLTANADALAGRSLAAYCYVLGDMRSIAPFPACLRRIQMAERNEAKHEKADAGRMVTRREVKCSGLNRTESGSSPRRQSVTFSHAQRQRKGHSQLAHG